MIDEMKQIINKVQKCDKSEEKCLKLLSDLYKQSDLEEFVADFIQCLGYFLSQDYKFRNPFVQRGLTFMAKFVCRETSNSENSSFLSHLFSYLLKRHNCSSSIWRYRICEFIANVLSLMQDCFLDDNICDEIISAMTVRLTDSISAIKIEAARALERLQDPTNVNDLVISKYIEHLNDDNATVRKQMLASIANSPLICKHFIDRILDVDPSVREAAYSKLAKGSITWLRIEQRQFVLRNLFQNTDNTVNPTNFVYSWYTGYGRNYIQFLAKIKLDSDENDMWNTLKLYEQILNIFFKNESLKDLTNVLQLNEDKIITTYEHIFEIIVYWRCFIKYVITEFPDGNYVDEIRPVLLLFCQFMKRIYSTRSNCTSNWKLTHHYFVMYELIRMVADFDLCDEVGRRALTKFLTDILTEGKLPLFIIIEIEKIFEELIPDPNKRMEAFCTIISEIREPSVEQPITQNEIQKRDLQIATLKVKLDIARDERDNAVEAKKFDVAGKAHQQLQEITKEIESINEQFAQRKVVQLNIDIDALITCVDLFTSVMLSNKIKTMPTSGLLPLREFIIPHITSNIHPKLVAKSLKALALCCYVDKKLTQDNIFNFCFPLLTYKYSQNVDPETLLVAMPACVDFALLYGPEFFITETNTINITIHKVGKRRLFSESLSQQMSETRTIQKITFKDVVESMIYLLNNDDASICEMSAKCLVKILKNGLGHYPNLITQLLIKWFHPNTMTQNYLSQLLGEALSYYAEVVQGSLKVIVEAFIPTINIVMNAPPKSSLLNVNVVKLTKFMVAISDSRRHVHNEGLDGHRAIAFNICKEIRARPANTSTLQFIKILLLLSVPDHVDAVKELQAKADYLLEIVTDEKHRNWLHKYKQKLDGEIITNSMITNGSVSGRQYTNGSSSDNSLTIKKKLVRKVKEIKHNLGTIIEQEGETEKSTSSNKGSDSDYEEKKLGTRLTRGRKRLRKKRK